MRKLYNYYRYIMFVAKLPRYIAVISLALTLSIFPELSHPVTAQKTFFSTVEDLPLMPGLSEVSEEAVFFDIIHGRIVEVVAIGAMSSDKITEFYDMVLPQLGWGKLSEGKFSRAKETLQFWIRTKGQENVLRISINPDQYYFRDSILR